MEEKEKFKKLLSKLLTYDRCICRKYTGLDMSPDNHEELTVEKIDELIDELFMKAELIDEKRKTNNVWKRDNQNFKR